MNILAHVGLTVLISFVSLFIGVFYSEKISPLFGIHLCQNQSTLAQPASSITETQDPNQQNEQPVQVDQNTQTQHDQSNTIVQPNPVRDVLPTTNNINSAQAPIDPNSNGVKINVNQYDKNGNLIESSTSTAPVSNAKDGNLNINVNVNQKTNPSIAPTAHDNNKNQSNQQNNNSNKNTNPSIVAPKLNLPPLK